MAEQVNLAEKHQKVTAKGVLIGILIVVLAIFCINNLGTAIVWPFGQSRIIVVILISFVLGSLIGWLLKSIAATKAAQRRS